MLSTREIAQFNQVCAAIGDEVADERGFVAIRDLIKRFDASVIVRPLLVEGMLASINQIQDGGAPTQRWAVLIDSETYDISDADIANESCTRPLPARLRNTIAHELAHSLAFRPSDFGITLNQSNDGNSKGEFVRSIEQMTESLSPLLLFTDKALTQLIRGRKTQVTVEELDELRRKLGISRDLLVARLWRLRSNEDGRFRDSPALRGLGVGIGEWTPDGSSVLRSWPLYINFDRNIAPTVFRILPKQNRLSARTAFPACDWVLAGGREHTVVFSCEAGLSAGAPTEKILVEGGVTRTAQKAGSAFLYVIRAASTSD